MDLRFFLIADECTEGETRYEEIKGISRVTVDNIMMVDSPLESFQQEAPTITFTINRPSKSREKVSSTKHGRSRKKILKERKRNKINR